MKQILKIWFVLIVALTFVSTVNAAVEIPQTFQGYIYDPQSYLDASSKSELNNKLKSFAESQSTQFVVAVVPSLDGEILEDVTLRMAETWKVGQKGKDNGVMLAVFVEDRKIRIEVGYGLEAFLTDANSAHVIRSVIIPQFKQGNLTQGVVDGANAIMGFIDGTYTKERPQEKTVSGSISVLVFAFFFVFIFLIRFFFGSTRTLASRQMGAGFSSSSSGFDSSSNSGFGGFSSSSSDSFSGGGGSFGGGGASGSW